MGLDSWMGRTLYDFKMEQAKRLVEEAADVMLEGDIDRSMELRTRSHQLREAADRALKNPWLFIAAPVLFYVMLVLLAFVVTLYLVEAIS
jgi:hypothetical protein